LALKNFETNFADVPSTYIGSWRTDGKIVSSDTSCMRASEREKMSSYASDTSCMQALRERERRERKKNMLQTRCASGPGGQMEEYLSSDTSCMRASERENVKLCLRHVLYASPERKREREKREKKNMLQTRYASGSGGQMEEYLSSDTSCMQASERNVKLCLRHVLYASPEREREREKSEEKEEETCSLQT
jgi:hypothetical protein